MRKTRKNLVIVILCGLLLLPVAALADSITPESFSATINVGESVTVKKTVTVTAEAGRAAPVDVFFLADTTGSMGTYISKVQAGATSILADTAGLGDVWYAVGEYQDWPSGGGAPGDIPYALNQDFTSSVAAVQDGIDSWTPLGYGGDGPESQLYALEQAATTASWRDGSTRIMVWFGDATGHDPSGPSTAGSATTGLVTNNITVEAISVGGYGGLGAQADAIALATGGHHYSGIATGEIVQTITDAITTVVNEYSTVGIDFGEVPAGVSAVAAPVNYSGDYDRSTTQTFDFSVTFTGMAEGTYDFDVYATVDGARVATESDHITVAPVPEPSTILLMGIGLLGLIGYRKKFKG